MDGVIGIFDFLAKIFPQLEVSSIIFYFRDSCGRSQLDVCSRLGLAQPQILL
jgi:hypothetical protein